MKMELGAQTFTVRDYMQTTWDFREAMKRIAEIGYTCVQLSAVGNVPVQAQRDICDEYGLKIVLTHTNPDRMIADPEGVIRDHDILGCDYIGIGMMNPKYQRAEWIDQFAKDFTTPAKKMRDAGKLLMYHNHNLEWTRLARRPPDYGRAAGTDAGGLDGRDAGYLLGAGGGRGCSGMD